MASPSNKGSPRASSRENSRGLYLEQRQSECELSRERVQPEVLAGSWKNMARPGPSWSRLEREQERELVHHVAGLRDEADPNFQLSLHFAWSNCRCAARRPGGARNGAELLIQCLMQ